MDTKTKLLKLDKAELVDMILAYDARIIRASEDGDLADWCPPSIDEWLENDWCVIKDACRCKGMDEPHEHCGNCKTIYDASENLSGGCPAC